MLLAGCSDGTSESPQTDTDGTGSTGNSTTGTEVETADSTTANGTDSTGQEDDGGPALPPRAEDQHCRFDGWAPGLLPPVELEVVFDEPVPGASALAVDSDLAMAWVGTEDGRLLVYSIDDTAAAPTVALERLDTDRIEGLVIDGPRRQLFLRVESGSDTTTVATVDRYDFDETGIVDPESALEVFRNVHAADARMGRGLALNDSGHLVIPLGDGAVGKDTGPSDDRTDRRGSVLRLDVTNLSVPFGSEPAPGNPWLDELGPADETWAIGARDPAGCGFDGETGELWCTDVGSTASEVTLVEAGVDLGWPRLDASDCLIPSGDCSQLDVEPPDASYRHGADGCGANGGAVVRDGTPLDGVVIYGDRCSGEIRGADLVRDGIIGRWDPAPRGFAADADGTVWAVDAGGSLGHVRVVPTKGGFPVQLSNSGCYDDLAAVIGAPDALPYELNAPLWTDGAIKRRHIVLPVGETIEVAADGTLAFPLGTVLLKAFSFEFVAGDPESERPVETRVMLLRTFGWEFHSYEWDESGQEATLLDAGKRVTLALDTGPLDYDFPSRNECKYCHNAATLGPLGPQLDQLSRDVDYGHTVASQLDAFESIGVFDSPLPAITAMADPSDAEQSAEARARAYLHANCGHCHRPGGWVPAPLKMDLRWDTPTVDAEICGVPTSFDVPWFPLDDRIVPGEPEDSAIWRRLSTDGLGRMPPLASYAVDPDADVVRAWIAGLTECPE